MFEGSMFFSLISLLVIGWRRTKTSRRQRRERAATWSHAIQEAVTQVGSVYVILNMLRKPYHHEDDFVHPDLDHKAGADIVVVKIGYLQLELFDMAAGWIMTLTPDGVKL